MTIYPLVSIIIPLYNHEQFIEQCLNSVLEDTYPCKEIVVIDDGSRDSSLEIARRWQAGADMSRLAGFTLLTRENRGVTRTLNELVAMAKGDFIAVLASDDFLLEGGVAARVAYLKEHSDKMAVFADCTLIDFAGKTISFNGIVELYDARKPLLLNDRMLPYEIIFNWCVPGPVFMARRELYACVGGYDETITVEDWDFYLRLVSRNLLGFINVVVAGYRVRPKEAVHDISTLQRIRFNEAMLTTVSNHINSFSGIRRAYLVAERLKFQSVLERLRGDRSLSAFFRRKIGRVLVSALKVIYNVWVTILVRCIER